MVRMLPIVKENDTEYFFDKRLRQLRNIKNPHDYVDLNEFEVAYYKDKAEVKGGEDERDFEKKG